MLDCKEGILKEIAEHNESIKNIVEEEDELQKIVEGRDINVVVRARPLL